MRHNGRRKARRVPQSGTRSVAWPFKAGLACVKTLDAPLGASRSDARAAGKFQKYTHPGRTSCDLRKAIENLCQGRTPEGVPALLTGSVPRIALGGEAREEGLDIAGTPSGVRP